MNIQINQIDSEIPVPVERINTIPLNTLKVGQSFTLPIDKRPSVQTKASKLKAETDKVFTIRKVDENNIRIWRTK